MSRGSQVLALLLVGVVAACASSENKTGGSGGSGAVGGAGGIDGGGGISGGGGGSSGSPNDATADVGGDTGQPDTSSTDGNASDGTAPDASADSSADASACTASSLGNCGTGLVCAPGDRCHSLYTGAGIRDWPSGTDATGPAGEAGAQTCTDSKGIHWPSEGVGSATWFGYIDCGSYKIFPVDAGCSFDILSYNDCCPGCFLNDVNIEVQEMVNGVWTTQTTITHPYSSGTCDHWDDIYVPKTSQVRLLYGGSAGFYVCVFQQ